MSLKIRAEWDQVLHQELNALYFQILMRFLKNERRANKEIIPDQPQIFNAFNYCPPAKIKCVIIGSEPFHEPGYADGLAFSVDLSKGNTLALDNIFKEVKSDLDISRPNHGCLTSWSTEGVLLMNTRLTVEANKPGSHCDQGWERFTDRIVKWLDSNKKPIVFMLWGKEAAKKRPLIKNTRHCVLQTTHPSPYSAGSNTSKYPPFLGSKCFSEANQFLIKNDIKPIDWSIKNRL